ncbi:ornithine cyclodeaminase family protein [Kiloniella sp. b19]|uniref:ornithine cyclodeaminase family protein n=1 Tax=Kiloniella sp. GXU_MW_B19 TaxID=3141326 RepID=UPI0031CEF774
MQIQYYTAEMMKAGLDFPGLLSFMEQEHLKAPPVMERTFMKPDQPKRSNPADHQTYLCWHAWAPEEMIAVKLSAIFPENNSARPPLPSIHAVTTVFCGKTGVPLALLDATELTYWKTAADSVLGAKKLARPNSENLLIVGAGLLAPYHIRAFSDAFPDLKRITVWNRTASKAEKVFSDPLCENVQDLELQATSNLEQAARNADIICCITGSEEPLVLGEWVRPGCHLSLTGSYQPQMRETDSALVKKSRLFVNLRRFTVEQSGDLAIPIAEGVISASSIEANLYEICQNGLSTPRLESDITLYKNAGGAHMDLITARYALQKLKSS